ncbi:hypothetical protein [Paenibacillus xylanexedens]|uniref:hypothetical protein n=1 Tax=Paenibacillus xylanexedens TaxID=528191 RepID=UPI000B29F8B9|nr:hypothetical protein [Paenibacillus xylanexedens]
MDKPSRTNSSEFENFLERLTVQVNRLKSTYPTLKKIYNGPYSVLKIIASIITLFSSLFFYFYILGYCFIYGYYFSGNIENLPSILNITINPVPIKFHSVSLISIFLFLAFISLFSLMNISKLKNLFAILMSAILIIFVLHLGISIFFVPGNDVINRFVTFLPVWIIPILLAGLIMSTVVMIKNPMMFFSGIVYGIFIVILCMNVFEKIFGMVDSFSYFMEKASILILIISFCVASIFVILVNKINNLRVVVSIAIFPFIYIVFFVLNHYFTLTLLKRIDIYPVGIIITFIISCCVSFYSSKIVLFTRNKLFNSDDTIANNEPNESFKKNLRILIMCTIPCFIIFVSVVFSYISLITGNYIRTMSPEGFRQFELIEDYREGKIIKGNTIKNDENTYYISNEEWELEILHSDHVHIRNKD